MRPSVGRARRSSSWCSRLRGRQVPLLLAYLVLARDRTVGRDELIGAMWPRSAPRSQDGALRTLLSRLRSGLGSDVLVGRDELSLNLPEPVWVDFEAAADRGPARRGGAGRRRPPSRLGAGPGPAQHRRPRSAGRGPGAVAGAPRAAELADIRLEALEVIGRAGLRLGRHPAGLGGASGPDADRDRALPRVGLRAADGRATRPRATSPRGCACSTVCARCCATSWAPRPSPEAMAAHERLLHPGRSPDRDRVRRSGAGLGSGAARRARRAHASPLVGRQARA